MIIKFLNFLFRRSTKKLLKILLREYKRKNDLVPIKCHSLCNVIHFCFVINEIDYEERERLTDYLQAHKPKNCNDYHPFWFKNTLQVRVDFLNELIKNCKK